MKTGHSAQVIHSLIHTFWGQLWQLDIHFVTPLMISWFRIPGYRFPGRQPSGQVMRFKAAMMDKYTQLSQGTINGGQPASEPRPRGR